MDAVREWLARLVAFARRRQRDTDFDAELSAHLELSIQDHLRQGLSPQEARRRALVSLGGMEQSRELHRETRGLPVLDTILQDLQYCVRLIQQMLTESLALSCSGAVLGLVLAAGGTRLVTRFEATTVPLLQQVRVEVSTLGFALPLVALRAE